MNLPTKTLLKHTKGCLSFDLVLHAQNDAQMFLFRRKESGSLYPKSISGNSIRILTILPGA
jgi:hypothetical protein